MLVILYFFFLEATLLQHHLTYLSLLVLVQLLNEKRKQTSKFMIYLSFAKLHFSSTFNYVQFNHINLDIKVPALPSAPHVPLPSK